MAMGTQLLAPLIGGAGPELVRQLAGWGAGMTSTEMTPAQAAVQAQTTAPPPPVQPPADPTPGGRLSFAWAQQQPQQQWAQQYPQQQQPQQQWSPPQVYTVDALRATAVDNVQQTAATRQGAETSRLLLRWVPIGIAGIIAACIIRSALLARRR